MKRLSKRTLRLWHSDYLVNRYLWSNLANFATLAIKMQTSERILLLDVGCGNKPYQDFFPNCRYVGLNYSKEGATPDLIGDAIQMPIWSSSIDIVLCTQVIEHVSEPMALMKEISRILKPDGVVILSGPFHWPIHEEPHDYYRYSKYGLKYLVENSGLDLLKITPDGGDWIQICCMLNHKLSNLFFILIRILINIAGLILDKIDFTDKMTLNYTLIAKKRQ